MSDSDNGFFGPGSHLWRNHQYAIRAVGYPVAVIIIAADPVVFEIISRYTRSPEALKQRLATTRQHSFAFIFGDRAAALRASTTLRAAHEKVRHSVDGVSRSPLEPELMRWVFAVLYYTSRKMNELLLTDVPFNDDTYEEYKTLGWLYGVPVEQMPDTAADFARYWNETLDTRLAVSEESRTFVRAKMTLSVLDLASGRRYPSLLRLVVRPIDHVLRLFCVYVLPPQVADAFDLRLSSRQRAGVRLLLRCVRWVHGLLPDRFTVESRVRRVVRASRLRSVG